MRLRRLVLFVAAALVPLAVGGVYLVDHGVVGTGRPEGASATSTPPLPTSTTAPGTTRGLVGEPSAPTVPAQTSPTRSATPLAASDQPTDPAGGEREPRYAFPISDCAATYAATHHHYPAADIFTARGCSFVAPIAGRVTYVSRADRWDPSTNAGADRGGLSVAITGVDGVQYYGSHLARVRAGIVPGKRVQTEQPLGLVGETGNARGTGPHLHFGISWSTSTPHWWIRRGVVSPQPFLDSWRHGANRSPQRRVGVTKREYGDDSRCRAFC